MKTCMRVVCFCVVLSSPSVISQSVESKIVVISQGPVRGYRDVSPDGDIFTFQGIPYATAPSGIDRFKAPLSPPKWKEPFEAVNGGIICPQPPIETPQNLTMREDCLVVNVFIPDSDISALPVLIMFHGGGFVQGFGNSGTPKILVRKKNIIAVTFNYRLGAYGFLCLGTEDAPGNAGMKDQIALLLWVKQNIASFGGNPEDVTVAGCSAGSDSIDILSLSKVATGLFKKAIANSASSVGVISVQMNPIHNAKMYAKALGFVDIDNITTLADFYINAPQDLLTSQTQVIIENVDSTMLFGPCIERDTGAERILEDSPAHIIEKGAYNNISFFYGFTNMEGIYRINKFDDWKDRMNEKFSDFLPYNLQFETEEQKEGVASAVREFYFGNKSVGEETILSYVDYFTDVLFAYPMLKSLKLRVIAKGDTIYLYEYSFWDENMSPVPFSNVRGVEHCGQMNTLLLDEQNLNFTEEYRHIQSLMTELWTNFIITGNPVSDGSPVPSWPTAGQNRSPFLSVGREVQVQSGLLTDRAALWDRLYAQHYRPPMPPNPGSNAQLLALTSSSTVALFYIHNNLILFATHVCVVALYLYNC